MQALRRFRRYRLWGSIPLLGWLFMQLAATGLLTPIPSHAAGLGQVGAPTVFITICTPEGVKEIALDEAGLGTGTGTPEPKPSALGGCEWCRSLDQPADIARPNDRAGVDLTYADAAFHRADAPLPNGSSERDPYRVRAPPI